MKKHTRVTGSPAACDPAYMAMIPKVDGNATPLGQRLLCVLPVVYRICASSRMVQLEDWFRSWVPDSVFSAGRGRSSVEAWYITVLDTEEVLASALFVDDVVKSFGPSSQQPWFACLVSSHLL